MALSLSLDELWNATPGRSHPFEPVAYTALPLPVQQYLSHAIAKGTPLASAVRLHMHGEIKLNQWHPFQAEQVICWARGMIWQATARVNWLPITGADAVIDGEGSMRWKLLGLLPVMTAAGPDISRSAIGRLQSEAIWLPSVLCAPTVSWQTSASNELQAGLTVQGHATTLTLTTDDTGRLLSVQMPRWGNPNGGEFRLASFGAVIEAEQTFEGYTIPSQFRAGWYVGSDRFESEGEFFRATIESATYRV